MSRVSKLQSSLQNKGYSKAAAGAIAYSAGKKKYGKEGMAKLSAGASPSSVKPLRKRKTKSTRRRRQG